VSVGDLLAQIPKDKLGAHIHASIAGRVAKVSDTAIEVAA
jgi:hypothetical protein